MPRTKRPIKRPVEISEKGETKEEILKKFDKLVAEQIKKVEMRAEMERRTIELEFKILMGSIPPKHLQMTVGQLKNEIYLKDTNTRHTDKSDDGYMTENSSHGSGDKGNKKIATMTSSSRSTSRRSRSADASSRRPTTACRPTTARRRSRSVYRTPAYKNVHYPPITPKVAPQTPLALLRQPRQGEMIVSMQGSPVMVPTCSTRQQDEKVNCDIVLADGTVLSLKPQELRQSQAYIPFSLMEPKVFQQLKTLQDNLDKMMKLKEKHCK